MLVQSGKELFTIYGKGPPFRTCKSEVTQNQAQCLMNATCARVSVKERVKDIATWTAVRHINRKENKKQI